jgi:hypothetical protein
VICILFVALKCGPPALPAQVETWSEGEGGRPQTMIWHVDYGGHSFACSPEKGVYAECTASRKGSHRTVDRTSSSDHNVCHFEGVVHDEDSIDGTYHCILFSGPVVPWGAKIISAQTNALGTPSVVSI